MKMQQEKPAHKRQCRKHNKPIIGICRSHLCDHYKQLCIICKNQHTHEGYIDWDKAVDQAKDLVKKGLRSLHATSARKKAEIENYKKNNMTIFEIDTKLRQITTLITQKIEEFKQNITRMFEEHVNRKIQDLQQIISKSENSLNDELKKIEKDPQKQLSNLFTRDLLYELKFYDSYFNEIFIKKTRHFRSALQNDKIFTLMVNFQQNLEKIFMFNFQKMPSDHREYHIFRPEKDFPVLYSLSKDYKSIQKKTLPKRISELVNIPEQYSYQWRDTPQSIFYKPNNCYYIFGEGAKPSRIIVKWQWAKGLDDGFYAVRSMETERKEFSVCELGGQIYIIGGQNEKQGCLSRCEKFVPLCGSQIYIIHSLNCKSSRHSLTTYKDKYILKFGGIKSLLNKDDIANTDNVSPPEIYSTQTQQWMPINIKPDLLSKYKIYPSIIRIQSKNSVLILGGEDEKASLQVVLQESKGSINQVKIKAYKNILKYKGKIINKTIRVQEEDNNCSFLYLQNDGTVSLHSVRMNH